LPTSTYFKNHKMNHLFIRTVLAASIAATVGVACAQAQSTEPQQVAENAPKPQERIDVTGHYNNGVGTSDAASQGSVNAKLIASRPTLRPAEVLEFVPGVIVTQHSGDGKANQYFLRGFNLDHGTDFFTSVDGMPVNMPTHAHGHGYSDLNWLIPELVKRVDYKKGPYYAEEGDFSSAGAAHIYLFDSMPQGTASLTVGANRYGRALLTDTLPVANGKLLYAIEAAHNDGPWKSPEKFHRLNGVLRYSFSADSSKSSVTAMAYSAGWNSTDQIPQRAVDSGLVDRFGALDASDGGQTARYSLSFNTERTYEDGAFNFSAYAIESRLDLYSNFTYFLDNQIDLDPAATNGDQFAQSERRKVLGLNLSRSFNTKLGDATSVNTLGLQLRHDRLDPVGLYSTVARERASTTQEARVRETSAAVYAENATRWTPWLRSITGLRYDRFNFDVQSSIADNSGKKSDNLASPKLSLILGPWNKTEYFINYGYGFHSNDARGVTTTLAPKERTPIEPSPALVRTKGAELGMRTEIIPGLQTSLALWQLKLGSELVFSGDAGDTEASGASKRYGLEFNNHYIATPWLLFDADIAVSRARFNAEQGDALNAGRYIPGSVDTVVSLGATVTDYGPWFGHFHLRYFGPRPLIEDNSQRSKATTLAYLRAGYKINKDWKIALDVFNLFDRKASDIDYYYASRLRGEPAQGVNDIHFHPVEPRSFRLSLTASF
jgi:outer membrane receptor protein involved in Fe transport